MVNKQPYRIKTISEYHKMMDLPKPEHPLISLINLESLTHFPISNTEPVSLIFDFYSISLKRNNPAAVEYKYGQQTYDFDEGVLFFMAPNQVFSIEVKTPQKSSGYLLFIHPDFIWNTPLAKNIKQYEFFDYSVHEALFLSEKEETMIINILKFIEQEYHANIDKFSKRVIIAQIELLLNYADRFYNRQFLIREKANHQILDKLEDILTDYFNNGALLKNGFPTVMYIAETINISPSYLSSLLKVLTGKSTQQLLHDKLIDKAKEKLSTTDLSVSEIAYELGFEYPQSFSNLFKKKTNSSPMEFRQSFN